VRAVLQFAPCSIQGSSTTLGSREISWCRGGRLGADQERQTDPVVVDHDLARVVGEVRSVYVAKAAHGRRGWGVVLGKLRSDRTARLAQGQRRVSWSHIPLQTRDVNGTTRVLRALVGSRWLAWS
jgi:hypothetical protein